MSSPPAQVNAETLDEESPLAALTLYVLRQAQDEGCSLWPLPDAILDIPQPELVEGRTKDPAAISAIARR